MYVENSEHSTVLQISLRIITPIKIFHLQSISAQKIILAKKMYHLNWSANCSVVYQEDRISGIILYPPYFAYVTLSLNTFWYSNVYAVCYFNLGGVVQTDKIGIRRNRSNNKGCIFWIRSFVVYTIFYAGELSLFYGEHEFWELHVLDQHSFFIKFYIIV